MANTYCQTNAKCEHRIDGQICLYNRFCCSQINLTGLERLLKSAQFWIDEGDLKKGQKLVDKVKWVWDRLTFEERKTIHPFGWLLGHTQTSIYSVTAKTPFS